MYINSCLWYNTLSTGIIMANLQFLRKLASDELYDTMFFATGEIPVKTRDPEFVMMRAGNLCIKIVHMRKIYVNNDLCKSVPEAKYVVCELISA